MPRNIRQRILLESTIDVKDSYNELASILTASDMPIDVGSFDDFVQTIGAKSYPQYDFSTWHIRKLCHEMDLVFQQKDNKFFEYVLPRYHLKSTIGYFAHIYRMLTAYGDGMYVSWKDELCQYHLANIKNVIRDNEVLSKVLIDQSPQSDSGVNYKIGKKRSRIFGSGVFSMKRGIHTDTLVSVDDVLGDLSNPMVLTELEKVKRLFNAEIINIPNKECPLFVYGTVIDYNDLLYSLKDNPNFKSVWLPALYPDPDHEVLWEARYDKDWLAKRKGTTSGEWRAFSTEFLLTPVMAAEAFITRDDIAKVINKDLKNYSLQHTFDKGNKFVVAGFDVGKKRHPSHLAIFTNDDNDNLINIHQSFWDNMEYGKQIELINLAINSFKIDKLYYDNTRSELEDRGLNSRICVPIKFTSQGQRNQNSFANDFAARVETKTIELIDDDRFISQITCVSGDLKAPETPMGHADSFWSCALGIGAYQDYFAKNRSKGLTNLGNVYDIMNENRSISTSNINNSKSNIPVIIKDNENLICKICGNRKFTQLEGSKKRCDRCFTVWDK